jgi:hypothetical protein
MRLLPSQLDELETAGKSLQESSQGGLKYAGSKIVILCDEIRACWKDRDEGQSFIRTVTMPSGHQYLRGEIHDCNEPGCPARRPQ